MQFKNNQTPKFKIIFMQLNERIWLKNYPKGIPHEINPNEYANLVTLIEISLQKYSSLPAFVCMDKTLTYKQVNEQSKAFGAYLQKQLGMQPGDKIAIMLPNILQYPIALLGALRAGIVVVNTNPLYTPREMKHQFNDSEAKTLLILENFASNFAEIAQQTCIKHVIVTRFGDALGFPKSILVNAVVKYIKKLVPAYTLPQKVLFNTALSVGKTLTLQSANPKGTDVAALQYTGGTTGVSKGAMLTHQNLIANMEQISALMSGQLSEGKEIGITALPLYHIFAFTANLLQLMKIGAKNILIPNPRDLNSFINDLKKHQFTYFTGVNTLFNALINHPQFATINFSSLKATIGGGMAVQKVVAEKWQQITKVSLAEGYGLTETSPVLCCNPIDGTARIGTIGMPVPSTDICILDDNNNPLPIGQRGEICAKGPQIMPGYFNRPDETAKVFDQNGWFHTGDIGIIEPDGFIKIVDRKKDMILVSGFNVFPNEVEEVVSMHPGVLEVAAIGVPDEKSGEAVKIFVVKKDPNLSENDLIAHCKQSLTNYKIPKYIEFKTELPKSNVGKILRRLLKNT